jgi:hypothetical protein
MRFWSLLIWSFLLFGSVSKGQDCINYHLKTCPRLNPNPYIEVPEGSKSALLLRGESIESIFTIFQCKDYRITLCSELFADEVVLKIYDADDGSVLLYDNTTNNTAQVFEFQVFNTRRVRAVVSVPLSNGPKKNTGLLIEKTPRGCVGLLLESMVTRK